ncbi:lamin tail domain-containing protein [Candidatus Dependentiae bacterium]|nr:lamin tail domain-containing protein [Candidatus Dependentiae bacterium]
MPWWWAQFSRANHQDSYSNFEKWHAYFINQASSGDTVYLQSMAWDEENVGTINWIDGSNSIGLNRLASIGGRTAPLRIIGDKNYDAEKWNHINSIASPFIEINGSEKSYLTHSKICYVANKGVIISSANHNRNGWNYEHNNSLILWNQEFPDLLKKIEKEQTDEYNGFFHSQTTTGNIYHYSPYGDTVELRFSPDDNNNGMEAGAASIIGRLRYLVENAKESIIYMANAWGSSSSDPQSNAGNKLKDSILLNTRAFKIGAKGAYSAGPVQTALMNDHTCRIESPMNDQHSKIFVIDMDIVAAGSANFSNQAMLKSTQNDEVHIILHDFRAARRYMSHFHHIMNGLDPENNGFPDNYDNAPPGQPGNLTVEADLSSFSLTWTKPLSDVSDFSRYYIFIDSHPINSNFNLGDKIDDDGDGFFDEDPIGNIDRFASNNSGNGIDNDDDADGYTDEDPWLYPEAQIKDINQTNTILTSSNVGDSLVSGVSYWFAVVAVDTQGNESLCDTSGPHRLQLTGNSTVMITEILYDNNSSDSEYDWIEVYNNGIEDVDLTDWKIIDGNAYRNLLNVYNNINGSDSKIIKPGQYAVICPYAENWYAMYGDTPNILIDAVVALDLNITPQILGLLSSSNDTIQLFTYPDVSTKGHSAELITLYSDPAEEESWQASNEHLSSTPGETNTTINSYKGADTNIVITEVMYDVPDIPAGYYLESGDEWVEIFNRGTDTVNITGWQLGVYNSEWDKIKLIPVIGDLYIGPNEFAVIKENSIWNYGDTPITLISGSSQILSMLPTGNTIALFNFKGEIVEQFSYPLIGTNMSIERKNPNYFDYTSLNWESSNTTNGETHTAGFFNTTSAPDVLILFPQTNYDTYNQNIIISGTTLNSWPGDTLTVFVDGSVETQYILKYPDDSFNLSVNVSGISSAVSVYLFEHPAIIGSQSRISSETIYVNYFEPLNISLDMIFTQYDSVIYPLYFDIRTFGTEEGDTLIILNDNGETVSCDTIILSSLNEQYYDTIVLSDYGDTVRVFVYDKFSRMDSDFITVHYYPVPLVKILMPENDADTYITNITVSGTTLGTDRGGTVTIFMNSIEQSVYIIQALDGNFSGTVSLSGSFKDTITVRLEDRFGRFGYDTVYINYFPQQLLNITSPSDNFETNVQSIIISGTSIFSFQGDTILLFVNELLQNTIFITESDSQWSGTVSLNNQGDSIIARLTDRFGRNVYDTIILNYYGNVSIGITEPWMEYDSIARFVNVAGTTYNARPGDTVNIFINGIFQSNYNIVSLNGDWIGTSMITGINDSMTAEITSKWSGLNSDTIIVNYFSDIFFSITYPVNNFDTNINNFVLTGTTFGVNGPDKVELFINGDYTARQDVYYIWEKNETWVLNANVNNTGESFAVKLTDQFDRIKWDSITVNFYGVSDIVILEPNNNIDTISPSINISGTTVNTFSGDTIELFINNTYQKNIIVQSNNFLWNDTINVSENVNYIISKLTNKFGDELYDTVVINYFSLPDIQITYPADDFIDTLIQIIEIRGTTSGSGIYDTVTLYVNNVANTEIVLTVRNGNFSGTVFLVNQADSLYAVLTDKFGRMDTDVITVRYLPDISVSITYPENHYDTFNRTIIIKGTTLGMTENDTLWIYVNGAFQDSITIYQNSGNWQGTACLTGICDTVSAVLYLKSGLTCSDYIIAGYYGYPDIFILYPALSNQFYDTTSKIVEISGTVSNMKTSDSINIYINDVLFDSIALTNNAWNCTVPLNIENETITIKIKDVFDRIDYDTIFLTPGIIVSGIVELEGKINFSEAAVNILNDTEFYSSFTDTDGRFYIRILYPDTFNIVITKSLYLPYEFQIRIDSSVSISDSLYLSAGDFFRDGQLNILDAALIKKFFGQVKMELDINGDGIIGAAEKELLKKNILK